MGDRVLIQIYCKHDGGYEEVSPIAYGHWIGSETPKILKDFSKKMKSLSQDVGYTFARLMQHLCHYYEHQCGEQVAGIGVINAPIENGIPRLINKKESHGNAGIVIISLLPKGEMQFDCFGGYLRKEDF